MPFTPNDSINILISAKTSGEQEVKSLGSNVGSLESSLKNLDATVQKHISYLSDSTSATKALTEASVTLTQAANNITTALNASSAAAESHAQNVRRLGDAHGHAVSEIAATSGALRELEGALPFRAVERFIATTLGLGPILQAAFPLIGLFAFGELISATIAKLNPLKDSQDAVAASAKKLEAEYAALNSRIEKLQIKEITDKFGKAAGAQFASFYSDSDQKHDAVNIGITERLIDAAKNKLIDAQFLDKAASGGFTHGITPFGLATLYTSRDVAQKQRDVTNLENIKELQTLKLKTDKEESAAHLADAKKDQDRDNARSAKEEINKLAEALKFAADAALRIAGKPLGIVETVEQQKQNDIDGINSRFGSLTSRKDRARASSLIAALDQPALENEDRQLTAAEYATRKEPFSIVGGKITDVNAQNALLKSDAASTNEADKAAAKFAETFAREFLKDTNQLRTNIKRDDAADIQGIRASGNQQADLVQIRANPGDELSALKQALEIRLQAAQQELAIKQLHQDEYSIAVETAKYQEESQKARFEYEKAIAEEQKKQANEFRSSVEGGVSALLSGGSKGLSKYIQGQGEKVVTQIAANAASLAYPAIHNVTGPLGADPDTFLGKLFKNTPLAADKSGSNSPLILSQATLTAATNSLAAVMLSRSGGGGSFGGLSLGSGESGGFEGLGLPSGTSEGANEGSGEGSSGGGILSALSSLGRKGPSSSNAYAGGLGGVFSGLGQTGNIQGILTGSYNTAGGGAASLTNSERIGGAIGSIGGVVQGVTSAVHDFSRGGASGAIAGVGDVAGLIASADPEPISATILRGVQLASKAIGLIIGNPQELRQKAISSYINNNRSDVSLTNPVQENSYSISGANAYTNSSGNASTSHVYQINVNALDTSSILSRASDIASAVHQQLTQGHPLASAVVVK